MPRIATLSLALVFAPLVASAQTAAVTVQGVESALRDARLALFSPTRAFSESAEGRAARERLTSMEAARAKDIQERNRTLETQKQALQRNMGALSEAAQRLREQEIERFQVDLQRFIQDAQAELMGVQRDVEGAFLAKLRPALDQVVKDKGLILVLNEDSGLIAWANASLDITPDVVKLLNTP